MGLKEQATKREVRNLSDIACPKNVASRPIAVAWHFASYNAPVPAQDFVEGRIHRRRRDRSYGPENVGEVACLLFNAGTRWDI